MLSLGVGDAAVREEVKRFIVDNFLFGDSEGFDENASFLESGVIDSTGILELVTFLEETYQIRVEDEELVPENLGSIDAVTRYLKRKRNGGAA
ncbi:MAG: acyl carrier protein [Desulfobacterales bacterium]